MNYLYCMAKKAIEIEELNKKVKLNRAEQESYLLFKKGKTAIDDEYDRKKAGKLFKRSRKLIDKKSILFPLVLEEEGKLMSENGRWTYKYKDFGKAFAKFREALTLMPNRLSIRKSWIDAILEAASLDYDFDWYLSKIDELPSLKNEKITELDYWTDWGIVLVSRGRESRNELFIKEALKKYTIAEKTHSKEPHVWLVWAMGLIELWELTGDKNDLTEALKKHKKAVELRPDDEYYWNMWGQDFYSYFDDKEGYDLAFLIEVYNFVKTKKHSIPDSDEVHYKMASITSEIASLTRNPDDFKLAIWLQNKAIELDPEKEVYHTKLALIYSCLAEMTREKKWFEKFNKAAGKALTINPKFEAGWYGWGIFLRDYGDNERDAEILKTSFPKFEKALKLNKKSAFAMFHYAAAISSLAEIKGEKKYFKRAAKKFRKAIKLDKDNAEVYSDFANVYVKYASIKKDKEKQLKKAFALYEKATKLNPEFEMAWYNWGTALLGLAHETNDIGYINQTEEKLKQGVELGGNPYNLACFYAVFGKKKKALKYLEISLANFGTIVSEVTADSDWANYLENKQFKSLIKEYT